MGRSRRRCGRRRRGACGIESARDQQITIGDVRQSRWEPLVRPGRGGDGRWTVDVWPPLEGRSINGGARIAF